MKIRKLILAFLICCCAISLTGCPPKGDKDKKDDTATAQSEESKGNEGSEKLGSFVTTGTVTNQLEKPSPGEEIISMDVKNFGNVKFRLFPQAAPNAVKNFKQFVSEGRYNGATFHRVLENFMIQAGREADEKGERVQSQIEVNPTLHHINGALCMARSYDKKAGQCCQFYIVNSEEGKNADFEAIKDKTNSSFKADGLNMRVEFDEATKQLYKTNGGYPSLDMLYTVFGQAYEGMDVIKKIAAVPKKTKEEAQKSGEDNQEDKSVPKEPVVIEKMQVIKL